MSGAQDLLIVDDDPALLEALPEALRLRMDDIRRRHQRFAPDALERIAETDYDALGRRHQDAGHGRPGAPGRDQRSSGRIRRRS